MGDWLQVENIKHKITLRKLFRTYIFIFCILTIGILLAFIILFAIAVNTGIILPANFYQNEIERQSQAIASAEAVENFIPETCWYTVFTMDGTVVASNTSTKETQAMWEVYQNNLVNSGTGHYKTIIRQEQICVIRYTLYSRFSNPLLNKYIPNAELFMMLLWIATFILEVLLLSKHFGTTLSKQMQILEHITQKIQIGTLDFQVEQSNIVEVNDVVTSLEKMKEELKASLKQQWKMEQNRKEQLSALAHDIKTPLTVLKGNVELLSETSLNEEQQQDISYMIQSTNDIELYISSLLSVIQSKNKIHQILKPIHTSEFIKLIAEKCYGLFAAKNIQLVIEQNNITEYFIADETLLLRAIMNVMDNAVEYSSENQKVLFTINGSEEHIQFIIEDSGRGFTKEELKLAKEQFYQGDKSRNSNNHYGMGLYIALNFVIQNNGSLILENSERLNGAKVTINIPIQKIRTDK
jgi:signal transduction histidine kinase